MPRGKAVGEQVIKFAGKTHAVVPKKHGIFIIRGTPRKVLDLAILAENSAQIAWFGKALGAKETIPDEEIQKIYDRQQNVYGQ